MRTRDLGGFISKRRKELNISQKDLSEKLNISNPTISKWENNERIPDLMMLS